MRDLGRAPVRPAARPAERPGAGATPDSRSPRQAERRPFGPSSRRAATGWGRTARVRPGPFGAGEIRVCPRAFAGKPQ